MNNIQDTLIEAISIAADVCGKVYEVLSSEMAQELYLAIIFLLAGTIVIFGMGVFKISTALWEIIKATSQPVVKNLEARYSAWLQEPIEL